MPFRFLKYLQPTHYFQLKKENNTTVFPQIESLPKFIISHLDLDAKYQSKTAQDYDLSWQAIQEGYIGESKTYQAFETLPVIDEYRFIRKNFHAFWVFYVLVIRLLSFKNPFKDIPAFLKTRHIKRCGFKNKILLYSDYYSFQSDLIKEMPFISIVIPTLNRYEYLKDVLQDLEKQTYTHFEVIIVDQSEPYDSNFYTNYNLDIKLIRQEEKALWLARNTAVKAASSGFIALSEDDVRVKSNWLESHLKCLDFFQADISAGVFYPEGKSIPKSRSFFASASQFATGNALLKKSIFKKVGLFDRQFEKGRMGDGEFGLRCFLAGFKSISNPEASCVDVKAGIGGLREMGNWDAFRPKNIFAPRPIPSVLYFFRTYFGTKHSIYALLRMIPLSLIPYKYKGNQKVLVLGYFLIIFIFPLVIFQMVKSWRISSNKIKEGALINEI